MNENEAKEIVIHVLKRQQKFDIEVHEIKQYNDEVILAVVSYKWMLNGYIKDVPNVERTFYNDTIRSKWVTF